MGGRVWLELFLLDNALMGYLILRLAEVLIRRPFRKGRAVIACAVGALCSALAMLHPFFLSLPVKGALLLVMACPFVPVRPREWAQCCGGVLLSTLVAGGASYALAGMLEGGLLGGVLYASGGMRLICWGTALCLLLPRVVRPLMAAVKLAVRDMPLLVRTDYGEVLLRGRIDTGNSLVEPLTGQPVIVVDALAAKGALPPQWQEDGWQEGDVEGMVLIPYATVQGQGVLPALRARCARREESGWVEGSACCIAVAPHRIQDCDALIGAQWI